MKNYDVLIIGAGPAGLNAGLRLTSAGRPLSVLIIDKIVPWERPIPCGEGVGRLGLEEALEIDPAWIRLVIDKAEFYSPDGTGVAYLGENKGFVIDRAKMQRDLAEKLAKRGVEIAFGVKALHISPVEKKIRKVTLGVAGEAGVCKPPLRKNVESIICRDGMLPPVFANGDVISARVVVDASGPVSLLGRGEDICWKPYDLEPAYFAVVDNVRIEENAVRFYMGSGVAPGGYAWAFPRGGGSANIGVVIGRGQVRGADIRGLLGSLLSRHYPEASVRAYFAGSIPCGYRRGNIALPGLVKCGDAANVVNPISRAGIVEALMSGTFAGNAAVDMLGADGDAGLMKKICIDYERAWLEKRGARHMKMAKAKDALGKVPDADYNSAAKTLSGIPADKLTLSKIFSVSLGNFPRLVWALRHLV